MHRSSDSRRYRDGDSFESVGEFEARGGLGGSAYASTSSSVDPNHRGLRWREVGVGGSGHMLSGRRVTARRAIVLGLFGALALACLPRRGDTRAGPEVSLESLVVHKDLEMPEVPLT